MNIRVFLLVCKSFFRRYKQVLNTCFVTFLVMLFVTATALFRDNMYNMQDELNKERFGSWFVVEVKQGEANKDLSNHKFLTKPQHAGSAVTVYDGSYTFKMGYLGYISEEFFTENNMQLREGHLPQKDNEVALEYSTLVEYGYPTQIGSTIKISYSEVYSASKEDVIYEEYILCGILEEYTELWVCGDAMPTVIVNKNKYDQIDTKMKFDIYSYGIKDGVELDDWHKFYLTLNDIMKGIYYNDSVYNYELWGAEFVYTYMYLAVVIIGVAILTAKIVDYRRMRKDFNEKMRNLGASKKQLLLIRNIETMVMIILFGILGIIVAYLLGNLISDKVEATLNIDFYRIGDSVIKRSIFAMIIAILASWLSDVIVILKEKRHKKSKKIRVYISDNEKQMQKRRLNHKNHLIKIQNRFSKSEGIFVRLGIRIFNLCIIFIILGSIYNVVLAKKELEANDNKYDLVATMSDRYLKPYEFSAYIDKDIPHPEFADLYEWAFNNNKINRDYQDMLSNCGIANLKLGRSNKYLKYSNACITNGCSKNLIDMIESVAGVENVEWGLYENQRRLEWEGINYNETGLSLMQNSTELAGKDSKYLFGTEYLNVDKALFERLSKYSDSKYLDYDAFCKGEQIILLLNKNAYGNYDKTIKEGMDIVYHYYPIEEAYGYDVTESDIKKIDPDTFEEERKINEMLFDINTSAAVMPMVASVIYLDENNKEEFADLITGECYYMAIASMELANKLVDNQNELLRTCIGKYVGKDFDALYKLNLNYNKFNMRFTDSAVLFSTDNLVKAYTRVNNMKCESFYMEKNVYREQLATSIMQNAVTVILALFMNIMVAIMFAQNRCNNRTKQFEILYRNGMTKKKILIMSMYEVIREDIWCIITLPIVILLQFFTYKIKLIKLK